MSRGGGVDESMSGPRQPSPPGRGGPEGVVDEMVAFLPDRVYLSIDIDALDPKLCPNTGTPVPGGLEYEELMYLLNRIREAGKDIVGFDLCEVSPSDNGGDWDGNVGARVLFHLCGVASK